MKKINASNNIQTRKIFKHGRTVATTLPKEFGFKVDEHIKITKVSDKVLMIKKAVS